MNITFAASTYLFDIRLFFYVMTLYLPRSFFIMHVTTNHIPSHLNPSFALNTFLRSTLFAIFSPIPYRQTFLSYFCTLYLTDNFAYCIYRELCILSLLNLAFALNTFFAIFHLIAYWQFFCHFFYLIHYRYIVLLGFLLHTTFCTPFNNMSVHYTFTTLLLGRPFPPFIFNASYFIGISLFFLIIN